jgi:DNA primase catalytic core
MSLRKLTAGQGYDYLTRQVAAYDSTEKGHTGLGDYYDEHGESPGCWLGQGLAGLGMTPGERVKAEQMRSLFGLGEHPNAEALRQQAQAHGLTEAQVAAAGALGTPFKVYSASSRFRVRVAEAFAAYNRDRGLHWRTAIPAQERAAIRSAIGREMFDAEHDREPLDDRELSGFVARASRQATSAVSGFDLTFSPVKSVSTLWAIAPREIADQVRSAHDAAVADTLAFLEREAAYTRTGKGGVRQVAVRGFVAAGFVHRDSRAGDPDLHTHVAVSNKVQTLDGKWLALDGRLVYAAKVTASEHYNTRLEAELVARLGVEFVERDDAVGQHSGKLPVREIRGISTALTQLWSRRRMAIQGRQSELAAEFQAQHGRPPLASEAIALGQQATLETRDAKHEHRSEAEQRRTWMREAVDVLGSRAAVSSMIGRVLGKRVATIPLKHDWVEESAIRALWAVEQRRATWQVWHVRAEAERQVRAAGIAYGDLDEAVDQITVATLSRSVALTVPDLVADPPELTRGDGESVYEVHGATLYTSARVLAGEHDLLNAAHADGFHRLGAVRVEAAIAQSTANGLELNEAQAAMVRALATSGAGLQLALAPAGTGKTTTMSVLCDAWTAAGGTVLGLAPSAQAAHELGQALAGRTDTLAKLTWTLANEAPEAWPRWIIDIGPGHMVIIDEAGQAPTTDLALAVRFINDRGGVVRLVGDDQQLAAVGAGGVLRDIQHEVGAITLSEVRRFHDPAEAAATLAVREGDLGAIGFYLDHRRIHVGNLATAAEQAYAAWAADRAVGLDALLLAPTREQVAQLNARARADLHRLDNRAETSDGRPELEAALSDGNHASAGDAVITRRNERRLLISPSNWVKNGDRWTVEQVLPGGGLRVRNRDLGRLVDLPVDYVVNHVQLGYATTVHSAQGMTTDSAHVVVTGEESRQLLYVALSRGRASNHAYLVTATDGEPHSAIEQDALLPPTAVDMLTDILHRDGSDRSATTKLREAESPAAQLHDAVMRYHDALGVAAETVLGAERLAAIDREAEVLWPALSSEPAYPTLRSHLALVALDGTDPIVTLVDAAAWREVDTSQDRAAVFDWRIEDVGGGPLPWLDGIPAGLRRHESWGPYLSARADRVRQLTAVLRDHVTTWTPRSIPTWADSITAGQLRSDLAVWRAAFDVRDDDLRPTGRPQLGSGAARHQRDLDKAATRSAGRCPSSEGILDLLPDEVRSDLRVDRLGQHLGALKAAGIDVDKLVERAVALDRPLPDECAADALWWRIAGYLGPAALRASDGTSGELRPAWSTHLAERLGDDVARRVMDDSMWPALVAAVHARPNEWSAEELIDAATGTGVDTTRPEDLCSTLVWRIATMSDPISLEEPEPPEYDYADIAAGDQAYEDRAHEDADPQQAASAPTERIIELNKMALDYFTQTYPKSWAPAYVAERLGTDLADDPHFTAGYAPPGPASLTRHLEDLGATSDELVDAGLAKVNDSGRLVDVFRDRLIFPIYQHDVLVGFVGRRNPRKGDSDYAGPKYLNTRTTAAFAKGEQLYGLSECSDLFTAGATPVLVEGPMDAIAVTLAAEGKAAGVAPLGTAFTEQQADRLKSLWREDPRNIVVATDPDKAGWLSAQRAFWRLAALRADPRHLPMPEDVDPADLLRAEGSTALAARLSLHVSLGRTLIDAIIGDQLEEADVYARARINKGAAQIIASLPPDTWTEHVPYAAERLDLPVWVVQEDVLEAAAHWTDDPGAAADRALAALRPIASPSEPRRVARPVAPQRSQSTTPAVSQRPSRPRGIGR